MSELLALADRCRLRLAYFICPTLRDEISALRDGNTKVVLENSRLLDAGTIRSNGIREHDEVRI